MGAFDACGNTLPRARETVLGVEGGDRGGRVGRWDPRTGSGTVEAVKGQYTDAEGKCRVEALLFEEFGAMSAGVEELLRALRAASLSGCGRSKSLRGRASGGRLRRGAARRRCRAIRTNSPASSSMYLLRIHTQQLHKMLAGILAQDPSPPPHRPLFCARVRFFVCVRDRAGELICREGGAGCVRGGPLPRAPAQGRRQETHVNDENLARSKVLIHVRPRASSAPS